VKHLDVRAVSLINPPTRQSKVCTVRTSLHRSIVEPEGGVKTNALVPIIMHIKLKERWDNRPQRARSCCSSNGQSKE
jgi:hypothetical protein